jgi:hypothetical protein
MYFSIIEKWGQQVLCCAVSITQYQKGIPLEQLRNKLRIN